jgi:transposase
MLTRQEMEDRRLRAAALLQAGSSQADVAREMGVSRTTACRWYRKLKRGGVEGLKRRRPPGRPCRLTPEKLGKLCKIYAASPLAMGYREERWSCRMLARVIRERLGVTYDPDHVGRLILKLGLRPKRGYRNPSAALSPLAEEA